MTLRLCIGKDRWVTIVSIYAPTMTNPEQNILDFYQQLQSTLSSIPHHDKIILLGDFNARVGSEFETWSPVLGQFGVGSMNANGLRLLSLCAEFDLSITNSFFRVPNRNKTSWMHPRSKHWHLLDYIIVRQSEKSDVCITKTLPISTTWSDHCLVLSKLSLKINFQKRNSPIQVPKKLNVTRANIIENQATLNARLTESLNDLQVNHRDVESFWAALRDTVYTTSADVLGFPKRSHQDWFDENDTEIQPLLDNLHSSHKLWMNCKTSNSLKQSYLRLKAEVQRKLRAMKNAWWDKKSTELQEAADRKDSKAFNQILKSVYGPRSNGTSPMLDTDGQTLITDKAKVLDRWRTHFEELLNRDSRGC